MSEKYDKFVTFKGKNFNFSNKKNALILNEKILNNEVIGQVT